MKEFKDFYEMEKFLRNKGYDRQLFGIIDIMNRETSTETGFSECKDIIVEWWNDCDIDRPNLKEHKFSYFLLYHLKREIENVS